MLTGRNARCCEWLAGEVSIHGIGSKVDVARPCDGSLVDEDLFEEGNVEERRERAVNCSGRHCTRPAIPSLKRTKRQWLGSGLTSTMSQYIQHHSTHGNGTIIFGGVLSQKSCQSSSGCSLFVVAHSWDELQSPGRQIALDNLPRFSVDCSVRLTIPGMEVGRGLVVVVHTDEDPVEQADRGHIEAGSLSG